MTLALALLPAGALAQQDDALRQAEAAYLEVDFEGTRTHALQALHAGGHSPAQLVRIYTLLGTASAALGREDEARTFFVRMLGLDRNAELDESVPPRLRDPYLEARGVWAARPGTLGVQINLDRSRSALHIALEDPTDLARRVVVHTRIEGEAQYGSAEAEASATVDVPVVGAADADRIEYFVEVLDEHGNFLVREGSPFQPRVLGRERRAAGAPAGGPSIVEEPVFWIVVGAVVLVGAAIAVGVAADQQSRIGAQSSISIGID